MEAPKHYKSSYKLHDTWISPHVQYTLASFKGVVAVDGRPGLPP